MMQVSPGADSLAACGRRWLRILKCCLLRSPQYPRSHGQVTHKRHQEAIEGLVSVFLLSLHCAGRCCSLKRCAK